MQEQGGKPSSEPLSTQPSPDLESPSEPSSEPPAEVANETCKEKEDKQNTKPDKPKSTLELTGRARLNSFRHSKDDYCMRLFNQKNKTKKQT